MPQTAANNKDPGTGAFGRAAEKRVSEFREQRPLRAGSLLITVFGDSIAPHGGTVWLGGLIRVLEAFGINQRLVRTSVFRLVRDGWLEANQVGRRSYYSLTAVGRDRFRDASRRIYSEPRQEWSGDWTTVLLSTVDTADRDALRRTLRWLGFAPFSANVLAHPAPDMGEVNARLEMLPAHDQLLFMQSRFFEDQTDKLRELVQQAWQLDELGARYTRFVDEFRPLYQAARRSRIIDAEHAFQVRTLLVHEYRKILLRDPTLPDTLLPARWPGTAAYQLCRNLYSRVAPATEEFLTGRMETAEGPLPPAEPDYFQRFGGLTEAG